MRQCPRCLLLTLMCCVLFAGVASAAKDQVGGAASGQTKFVKLLEAGRHQHIVAYGTSLTANGAWVKQLAAALNERYPHQVQMTNSGGSGQNSRWGEKNLQAKVIDKKPDVVFIEFAMNDSVARFHLPLDEARRNLNDMIDRIQKALPDCQIILQVMDIAIDRPEGNSGYRPHLDDYYQMYRDTAKKRGFLLIDHEPQWRKLLDQGEAAYKKYVPDGLHPNAAGCEKYVTPKIMQAIGLGGKAEAK